MPQATQPNTTNPSRAQIEAHAARKLAFDADLLIDLRDRTGQVSVLVEFPDKTIIMSACVDHDADEAYRLYNEFEAVFAMWRDGLGSARAKFEEALRQAGRVITVQDGEWHPDPAMPSHVLAAHFPSECGAEEAA